MVFAQSWCLSASEKKSWWHHAMVTFSALLVPCEDKPPVTSGFSSQMTIKQDLWYFLYFESEKGAEETVELSVIRDATAPLWHHRIRKYPDSKVHGQTWGPPGSCRPQMGPMLAPWTLLTGYVYKWLVTHYNDVIMSTMASQITSPTIVYSIVYLSAD